MRFVADTEPVVLGLNDKAYVEVQAAWLAALGRNAFLAGRIVARAGGLPPLGCRPPLPHWQFRLEDVPVMCGISLLRLRDVERMVGLGRTQIYRLINQGRFPGPISLGERTARWVWHEVQAWLRQQCPPPGPPGSGLPVAAMSARTV